MKTLFVNIKPGKRKAGAKHLRYFLLFACRFLLFCIFTKTKPVFDHLGN